MLSVIKEKDMSYKEKAVYLVKAEWDSDACCWSATSDDIPGLFIEADTLEEVFAVLEDVAPELIEHNCDIQNHDIPVFLQANYSKIMKTGSGYA